MRDGLELINAERRDKKTTTRHSRLKMNAADVANLMFQTGIQLRAGVSIVEALRPREGEDRSKVEATVRQHLSETVEQGTPLSQSEESCSYSEALAAHSMTLVFVWFFDTQHFLIKVRQAGHATVSVGRKI